ncbi:MAG: restriction endonuclease subunit S [Chloroflexi bacterium]|nr:restriction endonuclease subunit S [Chloroflexota bacterium]
MLEQPASNKAAWTPVAFGDVVRLSKARSKDPEADGYQRVVGLEHIDPGDLRIRRWAGISDGTTFSSVFRPGQVLFGKRRAYQRKVASADFAGVCSSDIYVLEPCGNALMPELLPFICQTDGFFEHAISTSAGSLSPRTNWKSLASFEFLLPPIQEQRRVVEVLRHAAGSIDKLIVLQQTGVRALASAARQEFSQIWGNYPSDQLAGICIKKPQSGIYKSEQHRGRGVPMVNMGELFGNDIISDEIEMERIEVDDNELRRYRLTSDDLLFGRRSVVLEGAGRCVLVGSQNEPMVFESSVLRATLDPNKANNRFVFEWLRSPLGDQQIRRIVTFTTVSGVAGSDVARVPIPLPPLETQQRIADRLSGLRKSIGSPAKRIDDAKSLSNATLRRVLEAP